MKNCIKKITNISIKSLALLAIAMVAFLGVLSAPLMNVAKVMADGYSANIASGLKLLKMPSKAKLQQPVKIPYGESEDGTDTVTAKILNPKGKEVTVGSAELTKDDVAKEYILKPSKVGTYKVVYTITNNQAEVESTNEFKIVVTGEKAVMSFEENSKYIIPAITNGDYQITLPNPTVVDSEGEELGEVDVENSNLEITIKDTDTNTVVSSKTCDADKKVDGHFVFTPNAEHDCTYIITYKYTDAENGLSTTEVFEVKYEKEFDPADIKLGYKFDGSIPESMELGVEQTLPLVNVYDENDSDLELTAYTDIEVVFVPNSANVSKYTLESGKDYVVVANSNVFTPIYPSSEGRYKIYYNISTRYSLAGNKVDKTLIYTVSDVKDSTAPTTYAVADYADADITEEYKIVDLSYKIPTKVGAGETVYFPAIYAKDNVTSFDDLKEKMVRVIVSESGKITTLENTEKTENVKYTYNETIPYTFTEAGTYTIRYEATDKANKRNYTGTTYTIVVEEGFADTVAPRITLSNIPSTVKAGEEISFSAATVVDYASASTTETEIVDKNVEVAYYYYTQDLDDTNLGTELDKARNNETSALTKVELDEDTNKYTFTAPESSNVKVVCVAYDDNGNRGIKTQTISIVNVNDTTMPTVETTDNAYAASLVGTGHNQEEEITLPNYVVSDGANTQYLATSVKVLDKDGNSVSVIGAKYTRSGEDLTISNARFIATKAGKYTIVYTISDLGGNYLVKTYFVTVADTKSPEIVLDSGLETVEVGEATKLPAFTVTDDSEIVSRGIRFIGDNNPSYSYVEGTNEFTALEAGIFTYEIYAKDADDNETVSGPYTFEAKDTKKPTITLDEDLNSKKTYALDKDNIQPIILSEFTAEDSNGIFKTEVIVKSPSGKSLKVEKDDEYGYKFTPTVDGTYTVIYSATDNANNTTEQTYTIKVGDTTAPSIRIENTDANAPSEMKVNSGNLKLELDDIKVTDTEEKQASDLVSQYTNDGAKMFAVTVTGPDGSTISAVEGKEFEYEITQTGKYTITYTARDKAGNEKVVKKYLQVYADDNKSIITSETWGIVLIVLALGVLAGVVIYFIKTRDKKPTRKDIVKLNTENENK